jgi:hypothetical protein
VYVTCTCRLPCQVIIPYELDLEQCLLLTTDGRAHYELDVVVVHMGETAMSGHYYAIVKQPDGTWLKFNDHFISAFHGNINDIHGSRGKGGFSTPYVLLYRRVDNDEDDGVVHQAKKQRADDSDAGAAD